MRISAVLFFLICAAGLAGSGCEGVDLSCDEVPEYVTLCYDQYCASANGAGTVTCDL